MIAVLTGASGFIGRNLVGRLLAEGHEVRCLTRPTGGLPPAGARGTVVDLMDPRAIVASAALDGAEVVFHLAGATRARSASAFADANVAPTRNLLDALAKRRLRPRFVHVSSQAAAGPADSFDRPVRESDAPRPVEEYGRSKLAAERVVEGFVDRVPCSVVRPCSVFGPFDRDFLSLFRMAQHGVIVYPGVAQHWFSWLHVGDVVEGLLAVARSRRAEGQSYFLASRTPIRWSEFGAEIERAVGRPSRHLNVPGALIRGAAHIGDLVGAFMLRTPLLNSNKAELSRYPYWVCASERAEAEVGWRPSRSLPDAVRDTYLWYQQSGWLSGRVPNAAAVA